MRVCEDEDDWDEANLSLWMKGCKMDGIGRQAQTRLGLHPRPPGFLSRIGSLQVWTSLQTRRGGTLSATLTGTAPFFFEKISICANSQHGGCSEAASVVGDPGVSSRAAASAVDAVHHGSGGRGDSSVAATGCGGRGGRVDSEIVEVLCTGSLYAVAAALEAFGAEVA